MLLSINTLSRTGFACNICNLSFVPFARRPRRQTKRRNRGGRGGGRSAPAGGEDADKTAEGESAEQDSDTPKKAPARRERRWRPPRGGGRKRGGDVEKVGDDKPTEVKDPAEAP